VGVGVLRMFKISDATLKPLPMSSNRREALSFTCHTWLPPEKDGGDRERQLLGTTDGEVLLFEVRGWNQLASSCSDTGKGSIC
jgi:hypothetical protein